MDHKVIKRNFDILNSTQAGVVVIDPVDMTVVEINSIALSLLGLKREDVIGKLCKKGLLCSEWITEYKKTHSLSNMCPVLVDDNHGIETIILRPDGSRVIILRSISSFVCENKAYLVENLVDVTHIRDEEYRNRVLLDIMHIKFDSEDELARFALDEAVKLTQSEVGYLHFVRNGGPIEEIKLNLFVWSSNVEEMCTATKLKHYPLEKAGIWADCIRLKKPVIHNDYQNCSNKKGYPDGHFPIQRHLSVPIFDGNKIVAVIGVGNKKALYNDNDVSQLCLFASSMWVIIKRHRAEKQAQTYLDLAPSIFISLDLDGNITLLNEYGYKLLGCVGDECIGVNWFENFVTESDREYVESIFNNLINGELDFTDFENSIVTLDGKQKIVAWKNSVLKNSNGDIIGTLSAGDDITNQRLAEKELEVYWSQQERVLTERLDNISLLNNTHLR